MRCYPPPVTTLLREILVELLEIAITEAQEPYTIRITAIDTQMEKLTPTYTKIQQELSEWQVQFENEVNGQRSGITGLGPRARSIRDDQLAWRRTEATRLGEQMAHLTEEKILAGR